MDETGLSGKWKTDRSGRVLVDGDFRTGPSRRLCRRRCGHRPDTVVGSMAQGREAALRIISRLDTKKGRAASQPSRKETARG